MNPIVSKHESFMLLVPRMAQADLWKGSSVSTPDKGQEIQEGAQRRTRWRRLLRESGCRSCVGATGGTEISCGTSFLFFTYHQGALKSKRRSTEKASHQRRRATLRD